MTTVRNNSELLPLDLTIEILLRLPGKSLFRFRWVSKTWCSIIRSRQFADAFMSLSLPRPRLILSFNHSVDNRLFFFSSSHQSCYLSSSSSMIASKKITLNVPKVSPSDHIIQTNSVRGFVCCICCYLRRRFVVCNPSTGQVISLPGKLRFEDQCYLYLGYDSSTDQYKVLRLEMKATSAMAIGHSVCTLGGRQSSLKWRRIKSSILYYHCMYNGVCIDEVVYYEARLEPWSNSMTVSSFDVGSEQLSLIKTPESMLGALTNYLGKLAAYDSSSNGCFILWVLDDVKNQVWSKRICVFPSFTKSLFRSLHLHFAGMTAAGEMVFAPLWFSDPFEIFCYHVEKKVERRVRVEGVIGDIYDGIISRSLCFTSVSCCYVDNIIYL